MWVCKQTRVYVFFLYNVCLSNFQARRQISVPNIWEIYYFHFFSELVFFFFVSGFKSQFINSFLLCKNQQKSGPKKQNKNKNHHIFKNNICSGAFHNNVRLWLCMADILIFFTWKHSSIPMTGKLKEILEN